MRNNKLIKQILCILCLCLVSTVLTGCANNRQLLEEITIDLDSFLRSCGNADYGIAIEYVADKDKMEGYSEEASKDTTGLIWVRIPDLVAEKMPDNTQAQVEARNYVGYGLKIVYDDYEILEIDINQDRESATAYVKGKGPAIVWESIDNIYQRIATETEEEFTSDYSYYKDKIESTSQAEVFNDIRNKVAQPVFKELMQELDKQESFDYIQEIKLVKNFEKGKWQVSNILMTREDADE